jgi:prepilin-type processing-associated H-X9-DG protein
MFNKAGVFITIPMIEDGLSNTLMLGETIQSTIESRHSSAPYGGWAGMYSPANGMTTLPFINWITDGRDKRYCRNASIPGYLNLANPWSATPPIDPNKSIFNTNTNSGFKSLHGPGANFAMGDGSIRFINQGIDHRTYQLLGCRHDGEPIGAFE